MDIGKAIKAIRKEKGIKQSELSELTGLSIPTISIAETNKHQPTKKNIDKICEALKVSEDYLYLKAINAKEALNDGFLDVEVVVNSFDTKYTRGFVSDEIDELLQFFPNVKRGDFNDCIGVVSCVLFRDEIVLFRKDVINALHRCLENERN